MCEWLAKPRITDEDVTKSLPTIGEFFPLLTRYFANDQKMRVVTVLSYETADKFAQAVTKTYGSFGPANIHKAADEALEQWIEKHL
jgi:hypothetical protein